MHVVGSSSIAIKVLVAAPHRAARVGAARALEDAGLDVVAECESAPATVAAARARRPDVCVVDTRLPGGYRGVTAALASVTPAPRVVVLGGTPAVTDLLEALDAGASGYLLKDVTGTRLALAVADVAAGHVAVAPAVVTGLVDVVRAVRAGTDERGLTSRERQVLGLLSLGIPTKQVAERLGLSPTTVRRHASTAARKLGAGNRSGAIAGLARVQERERR